MAVPFIDLKAVNNHFLEEYLEEVQKIFDSGQFILGPTVQKFEDQFMKYIGIRQAIGVNSGTDALQIALAALGVQKGDEVLCPAFGVERCADAIVRVGATPVLVDVRPESFCLDPDMSLASLGSRTRAIVAVHLFGQACEIDRLATIARTYSIGVVEDVSHAAGGRVGPRRLGTWGRFGIFSFHPTRNLGAAGDGGMLVTNEEPLADEARHLRDNGRASQRGDHVVCGFNSRLDALQAALLSLKLSELDENNWERVENARLYNQMFRDSPVETPQFRDDLSHVYNVYTILVPERDRLAAHLTELGIGHSVEYPRPLHLQPALAHLGYQEGAFPVSEDLARRAISLPVAPGLKKHQIEEVANAVLSFYGVNA